MLVKSTTRNQMTVTEKTDQILFPTTEIGGYISITNALRTDKDNWRDPNIQPTTVHLNQEIGPGQSDPKKPPIGSLNSGIDVPRSGWNIYNRTGMKPQRPIMTTIPEYNRANSCNMSNSVSRALDLAYRVSLWHDTMKS